MSKLLLRATPFVLLLAGVLAGAADAPKAMSPAEVEKMVRDAMALPADTRISWQDENGAVLPLEKFAQSVAAGKGFSVEKDVKAGTAIVRLQDMKAQEASADLPTKLPPLDVRDLYGRRVRNLDLAGRPTLINFYFETCAPCIKEAPMLNAFRRRHQEFNYLAVTPDSEEEARRFVKQRSFDWPVAYDGDAFIAAMKVKGYPTYVLVASDGRILARGSGMDMRDMADSGRALGEFERWVSKHLSR